MKDLLNFEIEFDFTETSMFEVALLAYSAVSLVVSMLLALFSIAVVGGII